MAEQSILVVDIGGNNLKLNHSTHGERRKMPSGKSFTAKEAVEAIRSLTEDWTYDLVTIGVPGVVRGDRLKVAPVNLGEGWVDFDFGEALGKPTKLVNDAIMQAIGSYDGGKMLFIGLGTGLGAALVTHGIALPLEVAHLPYQGGTFEDSVGKRGLDKLGRKKWERTVHDVIKRLADALVVEDIVLGGGNTKRLSELPKHCRAGHNENAFTGGFKIWREHIQVA